MMIDKVHQQKGNGLAALSLLVEHAKTRLHDGALRGQIGFVATDDVSDSERVLQLEL